MADPRHLEGLAEETRREIEERDYTLKVALLGVSVITIVLLLAAAVSENLRPEWRRHQLRYREMLYERADDERGKKLADDFEVKLRQVVNPGLGIVDRCVSCHVGIDDPRMADMPQPYAAHPGSYLLWHEVGEFGCTICHRGQGRATVADEAMKPGHHWDFPILPPSLAQSSCGLCHGVEEIAEVGGEKYALGAKLFRNLGCVSCHRLANRGGGLGPALDREGVKVIGELPMENVEGPHTLPAWLAQHFDDPQKIVKGSQMPPSYLSAEENEALTTFMLSLQDRDIAARYVSASRSLETYRLTHPEWGSGEELFNQLCATCHDTGRYGSYSKFFARFIPAVGGESYSQIASRDYVEKSIRSGHPGTLMPAWGKGAGNLSDEEIAALCGYLLDDTKAPEFRLPERDVDRALDASASISGDAGAGAAIFAKHCSGCHAADGSGKLGPSLNNPVFQAAATDGFIYATVAHGRRNTAMPGFLGPDAGGFGEEQLRNLVAHIRTLGAGATSGQEAPQ